VLTARSMPKSLWKVLFVVLSISFSIKDCEAQATRMKTPAALYCTETREVKFKDITKNNFM
jgi:hypothetical protein